MKENLSVSRHNVSKRRSRWNVTFSLSVASPHHIKHNYVGWIISLECRTRDNQNVCFMTNLYIDSNSFHGGQRKRFKGITHLILDKMGIANEWKTPAISHLAWRDFLKRSDLQQKNLKTYPKKTYLRLWHKLQGLIGLTHTKPHNLKKYFIFCIKSFLQFR